MMNPDQPDADDALSEDVAHRLLARAIELDARRAASLSVNQLREVAEEAGISRNAFEEALLEARVPAPAGVRRPSILDQVTMNAVAFSAFWSTAFVLGRAGSALTGGWVGEAGGLLLGNLLGVALARRLNARVAGFVLGATAIAQTTEFAFHLKYGILAVQSGPTHLAVILASALGVSAGLFAARRPDGGVSKSALLQKGTAAPISPTDPPVQERTRTTLRLRQT